MTYLEFISFIIIASLAGLILAMMIGVMFASLVLIGERIVNKIERKFLDD